MPQDSTFEIVRFPGLSDYGPMWELQRQWNAEVRDGRRRDTLMFLQHNPVYTLGRHADEKNLKLAPGGAEIFRIDRGGDVTFHGPGQLVVYVIMNLGAKDYGVKELVNRLEETVIEVCRSYGVEGLRREDAPGVWCLSESVLKKVCALGLRVNHGVTMHGLALNVSTDLEWFRNINPCGFPSETATSLEELTGRKDIVFEEVEERLADALVALL